MVPCMLLFHWIHLSWSSPGHKMANFPMSCGDKSGGPNWSYFQSTRGSWSDKGHVTLQDMQQMITNWIKLACTHVPMQQIVGCYPTGHVTHPNLKRVLRTLSSLPTSRSTGSALSLPAEEYECCWVILTRKWWTKLIYIYHSFYLYDVLLGRFCRNVIKSRMVVDTR